MKPGSIIIDVSVDQGGCIATTRPTTLDRPTFMQHGVVHYGVPNMTANVPRTASRVLTNAALPYVKALARKGLKKALREDPALSGAVYAFEGQMVNEEVGEHFKIPSTPIEDLLS